MDGQLARRDCRIVAQPVEIDQIFMVRESAAAVRLLHVIMLDEMRRTPGSSNAAQLARPVA